MGRKRRNISIVEQALNIVVPPTLWRSESAGEVGEGCSGKNFCPASLTSGLLYQPFLFYPLLPLRFRIACFPFRELVGSATSATHSISFDLVWNPIVNGSARPNEQDCCRKLITLSYQWPRTTLCMCIYGFTCKKKERVTLRNRKDPKGLVHACIALGYNVFFDDFLHSCCSYSLHFLRSFSFRVTLQ